MSILTLLAGSSGEVGRRSVTLKRVRPAGLLLTITEITPTLRRNVESLTLGRAGLSTWPGLLLVCYAANQRTVVGAVAPQHLRWIGCLLETPCERPLGCLRGILAESLGAAGKQYGTYRGDPARESKLITRRPRLAMSVQWWSLVLRVTSPEQWKWLSFVPPTPRWMGDRPWVRLRE